MAEVQVKGGPKVATNAGFRLLADFIFGNNTAKAEVAMTAPVDRSEAIAMTAPVDRAKVDGSWTIAFTMPTEGLAQARVTQHTVDLLEPST